MRFILIGALLISSAAFAQSYEETLKKCIKNFNDGLGNFKNGQAQTELERRYVVLNECIKGKKFPQFRLHTIDGISVTSDDIKDKVVLINFWSLKSTNSVALIPSLNEISDVYNSSEFVILSFASDDGKEVAAFVNSHTLKFKVFAKSGNLINHQFSTVLGYPTNIILNKKGEVADYSVGAGIKSEEINALQERLKTIIDAELQEN